MSRWPLNDNKTDACCSCGRQLVPSPSRMDPPDESWLSLWQPELGSPPQYMCGPCIKKMNAQGIYSIQQEA